MNCVEATCDIYIGKEAGVGLLDDIKSARKSVKIVSPYLSPSLIKLLINLRYRNLDVELITSDKIEDYKGDDEKNIFQLIRQNKKVDQTAIAVRKIWRRTVRRMYYAGVGLLIATIFSGIYIEDTYLLYGFFPILFTIFIAERFRSKIYSKRIYSYSYSQLFPFKVYMSPYTTESSDTFIHSKIYMIDDRIAYLGSLNFTASGTKYNHETRIRTEDPAAIGKIQEEIYDLMHHSHLPEKNIQAWGRQLYPEPKN